MHEQSLGKKVGGPKVFKPNSNEAIVGCSPAINEGYKKFLQKVGKIASEWEDAKMSQEENQKIYMQSFPSTKKGFLI